MMRDKGYALITDAMVALLLSLVVITGIMLLSQNVSNMHTNEYLEFLPLHYTAEDALDVMNKKGVLDEVGYQWSLANMNTSSVHFQNASNISEEYLDKIVPEQMGYELLIEGQVIANRSSKYRGRTSQTHATRLLVGYAPNATIIGETARSSLTQIKKKVTSKYIYFGGFVGQGNLSRRLYLPADAEVRRTYIEFNAGSEFDLYANGNFCGHFTPSGGPMEASVQEYVNLSACPISNTGSTPNIFALKFTSDNITNHYIGGGYIQVKYNTSVMNTDEKTGNMRFYLPEIEGILNYYSSFYVPGWVNSMDVNVTFRNNYTTYMSIGDKTIFKVNGSNSTQSVYNSSAQLIGAGLFAKSDLSEETVPIRLGTENITINETNELDIAIVNDRSGSMRQSGWTMNRTVGPSNTFYNVSVPDGGWSATYEFNISNGTERLAAAINWSRRPGYVGSEGSEFVVNLRRPDGSWIMGSAWDASGVVDPPDSVGDANEYYSGISTKPQKLLVENPENGTWAVSVYGWNLRPSGSPPPSQNVTINVYNGSSAQLVRNPTVISFDAAQNASKQFVDDMYPGDRATYVHFGAGATVAESLTFNKTDLKDAIDNTPMAGGTEIHEGIEDAANELLTSGRANATKIMIVLTDGQNDAGPSPVITEAQDAKNNNITIFSVGLTGFVNDEMLENISSKDSYYYYAPDASQLPNIYENIQKVLTTAYRTQSIQVKGNYTMGYLDPDSYIEFNYDAPNVSKYGKISITKKSARFNEPVKCVGTVFMPSNVTVSEMKVTSYSGEHWTDFVNITSSLYSGIPPEYRLWDYGKPYVQMGDPYIVNIRSPWGKVATGENNYIGVRTGDSKDNATNCSADDRVIYTVRVPTIVGYGDVFQDNEGCVWNIEFENTGVVNDIPIPDYYSGTNRCNYTSSNKTYVKNDAAADAVYRLLEGLDVEDDGIVDVDFDPDAVEFDSSSTGGIRSLWGPIEVKLVLWV